MTSGGSTAPPTVPAGTAVADQLEAVVCDLDGVIYHGTDAVPGAVAAVNALSTRLRIVYATNNASRSPAVVAEQLRSLGVDAGEADVMTSAVAGAQVLRERLAPGAAVLAVGGHGVTAALRSAGLRPLTAQEVRGGAAAHAVLQGYGQEVCAADLSEAAVLVSNGAAWVATNTDLTLPTERGAVPGNGTLVAAVQAACGVAPQVVGKPGPLMYQQAAEQLGCDPGRMLGVGDRLETDIAGANAAGMRSALVFTGVHGPADAVVAAPECRPDYVLSGLSDLMQPYLTPRPATRGPAASWECGPARAEWDGRAMRLTGNPLLAIRAALGLAWALIDSGAADPAALGQALGSSVQS